MNILIATTNNGKLNEFKRIFNFNESIKLLSLSDLYIDIDVEETGKTFEENASIKADFYHNISGIPTISEDSGLEIFILNGDPGIYSARYGGKELNDSQRTDLVLEKMKNFKNPNRIAQFTSVICGVGFKNEKIFSKGILEGYISHKKQGINGFGYDPIFCLNNEKISLACKSIDDKNKISHRRKSIDKFLKILIKDRIV
jgi:XTP/dITP diphosphohydrolase|tara:strand:- start:3176 stop:3775 length:600 start_codon:yes stop_codon:yes gene_type:complete